MIGKTLGHYEILAPLGKGGMGEVYRARDSKLGREVAIKILPQEMSGDPERVARFDREARLLASLQHANVASIYGFEHDSGVQFLAMELVDGQTLEERIREGALSADEALRIARQMAAGLEAAHEKGIIHRDLKPANVMLTRDGEVKILDFGLARAWFGEGPEEGDLTNSPTITAAMTQVGTILGTAAYMSPEQARGKNVDRRADIWAFGVILWEMATGQRLFGGETISDTLAAVIRAEPEWEALPLTEQPVLCRLIERCLVRDPRQRLRDIGEARVMLESDPDQLRSATMIGAPAVRIGSSRRPVVLAVLLTAILALVGGWFLRQTIAPATPEAEVLHASLLPPSSTTFSLENGGHFALSPDGSHLAFVAVDSTLTRNLWVRELSRAAAYMLTGTQGANYPFWSPDGGEIGFFADGKMKRIPRPGGVATVICDAANGRGGSWGIDDRILFTPLPRDDLYIVLATGGAPRAVTTRDSLTISHRWPIRLLDGEHFLYSSQDPPMLRWGSLSGGEGGIVKEDALRGHLSQGELIFGRDGAIWAQAFDSEARQLLGEERMLSDAAVTSVNFASGAYSVSTNGRLVYASGQIDADNRLVFFGKLGNQEEVLPFSSGSVQDPQFSPDGRLLAVTLYSAESGEDGDVWIRDLARGTVSRVTMDEDSRDPVWAPTQDRLAYAIDGDVIVRSLRGTREVVLEARGLAARVSPHYWTRDGRHILYTEANGDSLKTAWFDVEDPSRREILVSDGQYTYHPSLSPDEKWIVYGSNKTGNSQIYLRDLEGRGEVFQVTRDGASSHCQWSPDGSEIYYYDGNARAIGAVSVDFTDAGPVLGTPRTLVLTSVRPGIDLQHKFRVTPQGDRFLVSPGSTAPVAPLEVVSDWKRALESR